MGRAKKRKLHRKVNRICQELGLNPKLVTGGRSWSASLVFLEQEELRRQASIPRDLVKFNLGLALSGQHRGPNFFIDFDALDAALRQENPEHTSLKDLAGTFLVNDCPTPVRFNTPDQEV